MKWLVNVLFGRAIDRMADEAYAEFQRLSHCHRCGRCVCNDHSAFSDDTWDQQRRICGPCMYQRKVAAA